MTGEHDDAICRDKTLMHSSEAFVESAHLPGIGWFFGISDNGVDSNKLRSTTGYSQESLPFEFRARIAWYLGNHAGRFDGYIVAPAWLAPPMDFGDEALDDPMPFARCWRRNPSQIEFFPVDLGDIRRALFPPVANATVFVRSGAGTIQIAGTQSGDGWSISCDDVSIGEVTANICKELNLLFLEQSTSLGSYVTSLYNPFSFDYPP